MRRDPSRPDSLIGLVGISELHDLSFGYQVPPLVRLLSQEPELPLDLLRARPWLASLVLPDAEAVLNTLLEQEWAGFVAHLGRAGPWIYAATVTDLQLLSGSYSRLVEYASGSALADSDATSLLGRLWSTGMMSGEQQRPEQDHEAEQAFWALVQATAEARRTAWSASRGG